MTAPIKLPTNVATAHDIDAVVEEVKHYAQWLTQANIRQKGGVESGQPPAISDAASQLINQGAEDQINTDTLDKLIDDLVDMKFDSPQLTITLAALPTSEVKAKLTNWCRVNISDSTLVNFSHNRQLLGGMVVRCGSHIYDWSLKRNLNEHAEKLPQVLRNV